MFYFVCLFYFSPPEEYLCIYGSIVYLCTCFRHVHSFTSSTLPNASRGEMPAVSSNDSKLCPCRMPFATCEQEPYPSSVLHQQGKYLATHVAEESKNIPPPAWLGLCGKCISVPCFIYLPLIFTWAFGPDSCNNHSGLDLFCSSWWSEQQRQTLLSCLSPKIQPTSLESLSHTNTLKARWWMSRQLTQVPRC